MDCTKSPKTKLTSSGVSSSQPPKSFSQWKQAAKRREQNTEMNGKNISPIWKVITFILNGLD